MINKTNENDHDGDMYNQYQIVYTYLIVMTKRKWDKSNTEFI